MEEKIIFISGHEVVQTDLHKYIITKFGNDNVKVLGFSTNFNNNSYNALALNEVVFIVQTTSNEYENGKLYRSEFIFEQKVNITEFIGFDGSQSSEETVLVNKESGDKTIKIADAISVVKLNDDTE